MTAGLKVTGAVAARMLIKPGVKGRAVLFRTLLEDSSGIGVSAGGAGVSTTVTEAVTGLYAICGGDITMLTALTAEYGRSPVGVPLAASVTGAGA